MVEKLFKVFYKEWNGLHQAAFLLGFFALGSQVLALVRDRLLAYTFGASNTLDLYYAAFRIPDVLFASVATLVSVTVLIPFLVRHMEKGEANAQKFLSGVFTAFVLFITLVSLVIFFLAPWLSSMLYPAFGAADHNTLVLLTRILLLSPILLGISNLLQSVTQTFRRFFVYALAPILYNIGIIVGIVFLYPFLGAVGLVWGVVFGALMHMLIQIPVVIRHKLMPVPTLKLDWHEIRDVAFLSLPRTIGLSANNVALLVLVAVASTLGEGAISIFNFSFNLQSVPLSIIGVSYSVAAFPTLAKLFSNNDRGAFAKNIGVTTRHIIFWSVPIMVLFIVLRAQIVRSILGTGHFTWADTRLTAAGLAIFAVSLVAQSLVMLFARGYYAAGNTRKPLIVNVLTSVGIVILSYILVTWYQGSVFLQTFTESLLRVQNISGTDVLMLPLAYSLGTIVNALLLMYMFRKDFPELSMSFRRTFFNSFAAAVIMGFVAYLFLQVFARVFNQNTFLGIFSQGLFAGILGVIAGVSALYLLKSRELGEIWSSLHTKFWKAKPIAPEAETL